MIRTREEIIEEVRRVIGDRTDDDAVTLIEDISDTISAGKSDEADKLRAEIAEKEKRITDVESDWRRRYMERFYQGETKSDTVIETEEVEEVEDADVKIEDLFIEKKGE